MLLLLDTFVVVLSLCFGLICESCGTCLFDDISEGLVIVESCVLVFLFVEIDLRVVVEYSLGKGIL